MAMTRQPKQAIPEYAHWQRQFHGQRVNQLPQGILSQKMTVEIKFICC
jgi:hypothetical protein